MSQVVPVQLIVAAFQSEDGARDAWRQLKAAKWGGLISVDHLAIVRRTTKDKVKIRESGDPGGGRGAVVGTVVGGLLGAIAGPIGAVVVGGATGALVGGLTAKYYDSGIPNQSLEKIGQALTPGTSAIVAVIEHKWVKALEKDFQEVGATVITETLSVDISRQLSQSEETAFTTIGGEEGIIVWELVTDDDATMSGDGDEDDEGTEGAGVITGAGEEGTEGAGVITGAGGGEGTEGAGVITGAGGDEGTEGAGVITGGGEEGTEGAGVITGGDDK